MLTDSQRAALAQRLRRSRTETGSAEPVSLKPRDPQLQDLPLSFGQEQLWFLDRFAPGEAMYNIPIAISLDGALDEGALQAALDALAQRHEPLRTRLVTSKGQPVQRIDPPRQIPMTIIDLSGGEPDSRLREFIATEALRPFDLAAGPLMRVSLIRLGTGRHVLLQIFHHAIFDGWSANVLLRELAALYRQRASGEPSGLAQLPVQFADYAIWERARLTDAPPNGTGPDNARTDGGQPAPAHPNGARADEAVRYWREVMDGFETVRFPAD